jgi:hypothetical protein
MSPATEDAVRLLVRAAVLRLDEILSNHAPEWKMTTRWERGQDGFFHERKVIEPALWFSLERMLPSVREYLPCVELLKSDSVIGPHLGRLVGTKQMAMRLEADRIVSLLAHTMLDSDGRPAFKDDRFDEMWREIVEFFGSDCVPFNTVAPLPRLVIPQSPVRLNSEIVLDRLTDEEVTRCWEAGVLRPCSPRFPFIETEVAIGIRKTTYVPKLIQADDEPPESPSEANTGSFGNRCPFREDLLIDDVLSALRLFKHTQLRSAGHASWTDGYWLGDGTSFRSLGQWPYGDKCELSEADVPQFLEVWRLLEAGSDEMDFTLRRFNLSFERRLGDDRLVDLVIAAESLFLGDLGAQDRGELRFRFALRAAKFIDHASYNERDVYRVMRRAYDARSAVVHGGSPKDTDLPDNQSASLQIFTDAIEEIVRLGLRKAIALNQEGKSLHKSEYWDDLLMPPPNCP